MATSPTNPPSLTDFPPSPNRNTESGDTYTATATVYMDFLPTNKAENQSLADWTKATADQVYANAIEAGASTTEAESFSQLAQATANYDGDWAGKTGSVSTPYSASHSGLIWALKNDLADISASEPGVSSDWLEIEGLTSAQVYSSIGDLSELVFKSVSDLKLGTTQGGQSLVDQMKLAMDSGPIKLSSHAHTAGMEGGAADYSGMTLAAFQALRGVGATPDGERDHYLFGGVEYVAAKDTSSTGQQDLSTKEQVTPITPKRGIISFVYDAAFTGQYTVVKPLLDARGLTTAITIPVRSFFTGTSTYMTAQQLYEFISDGAEIMSHTMTTPNWAVFGGVSESEARWEFEESRKQIETLGVSCFAMQTPQTDMAAGYRPWAADHYNFVFTSGADGAGITPLDRLNSPITDRTDLKVMSMYANSLSDIYAAIDAAEEYGYWLVLKDHEPGGGGYTGDSATPADTALIMDYVKAKIDAGTVVNLNPSDAFSQMCSYTPKGLQVDRIKTLNNTPISGRNLAKNTELKTYGFTQPESWVMTDLAGSDTPTIHVDETAIMSTLSLEFAGANAANDTYFVYQDLEVDRAGFNYLAADISNGTPLTFSLDVSNTTDGITANPDADTFEYELLIQGRDAYPNGAVVREERVAYSGVKANRNLSLTVAGLLRNGSVKSLRYGVIVKRTSANTAGVLSISQPQLERGTTKSSYSAGETVERNFFTTARVGATASATASVKTKIPYSSVIEGDFNGVSNSYFAELGGVYDISAHTWLTNLSPTANVYLYVDVNGTTQARQLNTGSGSISCKLRLVKGDEVTFWVNQQDAAARDIRTDLDSQVFIARIPD